MLVKTQAILLHHVRYSDNSLIARLYTRDYGRMSVMVRGLSSRKGGMKFAYFQPLNIFNIELYHNENREVQNLKELSLSFIPKKIPSDITRRSVAMFMSEILYSVIREEDPNRMLYDFIESSIITLDEMEKGLSNFHLWFLVAFTSYAGIGPSSTNLDDFYFDMLSGQFTGNSPMHPDCMEPRAAAILNHLLQITPAELETLYLTGEERSELLTRMLRYYTLHLTGIKQIHSLSVLREIFR
jgi:DNA repair protein RecO (recombination protein O)